MKAPGIVFAGILAVVASTAGASAQADGDVEIGQAKYAESCASCHGPAGRGMASFPSVRGKDFEYVSSRLTRYRAGEQIGPNSLLMIPMSADLTDADIANLAAFISTKFK